MRKSAAGIRGAIPAANWIGPHFDLRLLCYICHPAWRQADPQAENLNEKKAASPCFIARSVPGKSAIR